MKCVYLNAHYGKPRVSRVKRLLESGNKLIAVLNDGYDIGKIYHVTDADKTIIIKHDGEIRKISGGNNWTFYSYDDNDKELKPIDHLGNSIDVGDWLYAPLLDDVYHTLQLFVGQVTEVYGMAVKFKSYTSAPGAEFKILPNNCMKIQDQTNLDKLLLMALSK